MVSPGLSAPDPLGAALMAVAGVAWGIYSLRGAGGQHRAGRDADEGVQGIPGVVHTGDLVSEELDQIHARCGQHDQRIAQHIETGWQIDLADATQPAEYQYGGIQVDARRPGRSQHQ